MEDKEVKDPDQTLEEEVEEAAGTEETAEAEETVSAEDAQAEDGEKEEAEDGEPEPKKGLFGKKKKDKKDAQIEELTDRVRRQMAEFDNFRKRTEKEKSAMYETGVKSTVEKILPVVDNFERGLEAANGSEDPFVEGIQKIYKQLISVLEAMEVKPIEAVGAEFDPSLHNAVMHVEDDSVGENIIVEEFQKGYTYRDSVIRHSMVKVAN